jgi:hypothetical protein
MNLQVLCIYNGIPLFICPSAEVSKNSNTLISGFLTAINMFAKQTVGVTISNMTLGDSLWTFTNIYNIDDLFLVSQFTLTGHADEKKFKTKIISQLISEIVTEFQNRYPRQFFLEFQSDSKIFAEFSAYVNEKIDLFTQLLHRYEKRDLLWLAHFDRSEFLFTAIMDRIPILIIVENLNQFEQSEEKIKLRGTFESILNQAVPEFISLTMNNLQSGDLNSAGKIYVIDRANFTDFSYLDWAIIDLSAQKVIRGPEPNPISTKIVLQLRGITLSDKHKPDFDVSNMLKNNKPNLNGIFQNSDIILTQFNCKLCGMPVEFDITDESTYIQKKPHQTFFNMELTTYKVAHFNEGLVHINNILADDKGLFHGLIDAYSIDTKELAPKHMADNRSLMLIAESEEPLRTHKFIDTMYIIDHNQMWLMEIICDRTIRSTELGGMILAKKEEMSRVYAQLPPSSSFPIGDKQFHCWFSGAIIIAMSFKEERVVPIFDELIHNIIKRDIQDQEWLLKRTRLKIALRYAETIPLSKLTIPYFLKILFNDSLSSKIVIKYPSHVPRIAARLKSEFAIAPEALDLLLSNKTTIIDMINKEFLPRTSDLIDLVEFINRRNMVL